MTWQIAAQGAHLKQVMSSKILTLFFFHQYASRGWLSYGAFVIPYTYVMTAEQREIIESVLDPVDKFSYLFH